jgi:2-desacetyl-2-hydroxyethyl bacteriochlorophyllide A dehydrogenase
MKTITLESPGKFRTSETEMPEIDSDEILVKTLQVGICGTDLKMFNGTYNGLHKYPVIPGHEWIGEIAEIGNQVQGFDVGQKVMGSVSMWCGECMPCIAGNTESCDNLAHFGLSANGAAREYFSIKPTFLYKIPTNIDIDTGVLVEPIAVAYHGLSLIGGAKSFNSIVVLGAGPIGLSCIAVAKMTGAREIIAIDYFENRLDAAKNMGATTQINARNEPAEELKNITRGVGVDLCIDAAGEVDGFPPAILTAIKSVHKLGKILLIGYYKKPLPLPLEEIVNKGIVLQGKIPGAQVVFPEAINLLATSKNNIRNIITSHYPLQKAEDAFRVAMDKEKSIKVVMKVAD